MALPVLIQLFKDEFDIDKVEVEVTETLAMENGHLDPITKICDYVVPKIQTLLRSAVCKLCI